MVRIIIYVVIYLIDKFKYLELESWVIWHRIEKVQVGNDQENAQTERNYHSESRGGKKINWQLGTYKKSLFI